MDWHAIFSQSLQQGLGPVAAVYCLAAIGLNVHFGYTGLLNFGQAGFMAVGGYAVSSFVATWGLSFWLGCLVGLGAAAVLALLLGVPTLRLRADYLAIVTIAASEIVRISLNSVRFTWLTGGNDGLQNFTGDLRSVNPIGPHRFSLFAQRFNEYDLFIIICGWILVALASAYVYYLMRSPWG